MQRALYSLLLYLALPLQALRLLWRGWRDPANRHSLRAHLALGLAPRAESVLWLHAASVGEVLAVVPLVERLRRGFPGLPLLVTVGTATGLAAARQRLPTTTLLPAPWDLPGVARRFMATQKPCAAVFIETELWPNLLHAASRARLPLLLASARVSARSTRRYARWAAALMRDTVRTFTWIGAQTPADRDRFIALGADPARVGCAGNLKFDFTPPPATGGQGAALRARLAPGRPMWVAGSTHAADEMACLSAQRLLQQQARERRTPAPLLVIAPRRPERFEEVAASIVAQGFALQRHSARRAGDGDGIDAQDVEVLLLDAMGELLPYYAAADAVFVGGSIAVVGGHNLLEPAALGKPVLAGPHTGNAPQVAALLEAAHGLVRVTDATTLAGRLGDWFADPAQARRCGSAAAAVVADNAGATTRVLEAITAALALQAGPAAPRPPAPSASG